MAGLSEKQTAYQEFFFGLMDEYKVNSPSELSEEKKKEFFTAVKKGWKKLKKELFTENSKNQIKTLIKEYRVMKFKKLLENIETELTCENSEELNESDYQDFFLNMLKQHGISSLNDLSDQEKKDFFNTIKKEWKGDINEIKEYFI